MGSSSFSLLTPALIGLMAGVGHGILSHHLDLPVSLGEQLVLPLQVHPSTAFQPKNRFQPKNGY